MLLAALRPISRRPGSLHAQNAGDGRLFATDRRRECGWIEVTVGKKA
jgi:hypothetical protein